MKIGDRAGLCIVRSRGNGRIARVITLARWTDASNRSFRRQGTRRAGYLISSPRGETRSRNGWLVLVQRILTRYCTGWSGFALSAALQEPDLEQPKRKTFFLRECP